MAKHIPYLTRLAQDIIEKNGHKFKYVVPLGWFVYDGSRWRHDADGNMVYSAIHSKMMKEFEQAVIKGVDRKDVERLCDTRGYERIARLTRNIRPDLTIDQMDVNPYELNTSAGVLSLGEDNIGQVRKTSADDLLTLTAGAEYDSRLGDFEGTRFYEFLRYFQPDPKVRRLLRQHAGIGLVGETLVQRALFHHGADAWNGKTAYHKLISRAFGDYAGSPNASLFTSREPKEHQVAGLLGKRFVEVKELPRNAFWNEELFKAVVGGDQLTGSLKFKPEFEFDSVATVSVHTNHLPKLRAGDAGTYRRILVVPWEIRTTDAEKTRREVQDIFRKELSVILTWAVRGLMDYYENGLVIPSIVQDATDDYLNGSNPVKRWIDKSRTVVKDAGAVEYTEDLRACYNTWAETVEGMEIISQTAFPGYLTNCEIYGTTRRNNRTARKGLKIL
ncbi:DNA primase family protein [Gordonia sp. NPDC003950]